MHRGLTVNEKQAETIWTVTKEEVKLIEGMMEDKPSK